MVELSQQQLIKNHLLEMYIFTAQFFSDEDEDEDEEPNYDTLDELNAEELAKDFAKQVSPIIGEFPFNLEQSFLNLYFPGGGIHFYTIIKFLKPPTHFINLPFGVIEQFAFIVDTDMGSYHGHITKNHEDHYSDGYYQSLEYEFATREDYDWIKEGSIYCPITAILLYIQLTSELTYPDKELILTMFSDYAKVTYDLLEFSNNKYGKYFLPIESNKEAYEKLLLKK